MVDLRREVGGGSGPEEAGREEVVDLRRQGGRW